ncbi:unnamed protein product [Caenorhabditis auriculariae]|uniref:BTB domain-containing protein n=1 Tax=Caenorhabditis auriculariae TaxID=2777116 RepID=A0A8S1HV76_9PELO|nr:unnamed protein product [Caenorhabditis auriculariae]
MSDKNPIVTLNVGGQLFNTRLETLGNRGRNELYKIYSGETKPEKDGTYFIDRDPKLFHYILNYMRDGRIIFPKKDLITMQISQEVGALGLEELSKNPEVLPGGAAENIMITIFSNTI